MPCLFANGDIEYFDIQEATRYKENVINVLVEEEKVTYEHQGVVYDSLAKLKLKINIKTKFMIHILRKATSKGIKQIYLDLTQNGIKITCMTIVNSQGPPGTIRPSEYLD